MTIDKYGLLVLDDGDGGDSARMAWSAHIAECYNLSPYYSLFDYRHTELRRHPDFNTWPCGRDQTLHAFTYLATFRTRAFSRFLWAHLARGLRCQNGEILWFNLSVITRAINKSYLYPITVLFDFALVAGVMERCHWLPRWDQDNKKFVWRNDPDDVGDDLNLQMSLLQPNHPSPVRWFARMLYKHCRPKTYGNAMDGCINTSHGCWLWYYRKEERNKHNLALNWAENCRKWL